MSRKQKNCNIQELKKRTVNKLFFNKYRYSLKVSYHHASLFREGNKEKIDARIHRRNQVRLWYVKDPLSERDISNIDNLYSFIQGIEAEVKVSFCNSGALIFYSNDVNALKTIAKFRSFKEHQYSYANGNNIPNSIRLMNPKYKFRSFFKSQDIYNEDALKFTAFLKGHPEWRLSPVFSKIVHNYPFPILRFQGATPLVQLRVKSYYFIDYSEESEILALHMYIPGIIRKTYSIV